MVNGKAVPNTVYRGTSLAVAAGVGLEQLLPKGATAQISILNPDGSRTAALAFRR
jgi:hypothetical protein